MDAGSDTKRSKVVAIGSSIVDFETITSEDLKNDGGSYKGRVVQRCGGVGRNHAEAIGRLTVALNGGVDGAAEEGKKDIVLLSAVGCDTNGEYLMRKTGQFVDVSRVRRCPSVPTATHMSMNQRGTIIYGVSCFEEILREITPEYITDNEDVLASSDYIICDANVPLPTLNRVLEIARDHGKKVWFESTEQSIATKFIDSSMTGTVSALSANAEEFLAILKKLGVNTDITSLANPTTLFALIKTLPPLLPELDLLLVTMAEQGSLLISKKFGAEKYWDSVCGWGFVHIIPAAPMMEEVVSASGAGDTMNSALLFALLHDRSLGEAIDFSLQAVVPCLGVTEAVAETLNEMTIPWK